METTRNLLQCKACREQISSDAHACPHCGEPYDSEPVKLKIPVVFYFAAVMWLVIGACVILNHVLSMLPP
jgi:predicted amidophosphoribosyltransferase